MFCPAFSPDVPMIMNFIFLCGSSAPVHLLEWGTLNRSTLLITDFITLLFPSVVFFLIVRKRAAAWAGPYVLCPPMGGVWQKLRCVVWTSTGTNKKRRAHFVWDPVRAF